MYERDDAVGGLLRYGIPDFKLEKRHIDRRVAQLDAEGVRFVTGCAVGTDLPVERLRERTDAILLACGALTARDTPDTPGRGLRGVHLAMEHLVGSNRHVAGTAGGAGQRGTAGGAGQRGTAGGVGQRGTAGGAGRHGTGDAPPIDAGGRHVVIIGGGDTAADCLGVAHRQGAAGVAQLDIYPLPPGERDESRDPWPTWPWILRNYPAHEEGGERVFAVAVQAFLGDDTGHVRAVRVAEVTVTKQDGRRMVAPVPGTERDLPADLVLLAIGFDGTEEGALLDQFGLSRRGGTIACGPDWQTDAEGVFVAGDMHRGASLIVWAIAEGRAAAAAIHEYLGGAGSLPAPVTPGARPLVAR